GGAAVPDRVGKLAKGIANSLLVERLIVLRPEYFWKKIGDEFADHDIRIGHRKRSTAAIAFRPRIGACAVRSDAEARPIEVQNRAAAGSDGVDEHDRRAHANTGDLGFEGALKFAVEMRNVGGRAAHVESDKTLVAGLATGLCHAYNAGCRTRQD